MRHDDAAVQIMRERLAIALCTAGIAGLLTGKSAEGDAEYINALATRLAVLTVGTDDGSEPEDVR
jgi:hypothetical protein